MRFAVIASARRNVLRVKVKRHQLSYSLCGSFTFGVECAIKNHAEERISEGRVLADAEVARLVVRFDCAARDFRQRVPARHCAGIERFGKSRRVEVADSQNGNFGAFELINRFFNESLGLVGFLSPKSRTSLQNFYDALNVENGFRINLVALEFDGHDGSFR